MPSTKNILLIALASLLSACAKLSYQPIPTIEQIDHQKGYRLRQALDRQQNQEDLFVVLTLSGGGSRAAALGYGVLEALAQQNIALNGRQSNLLEEIDLVYGISGGSVLAMYFALHGKDTIPQFLQRFLAHNFQDTLIEKVFSLANVARLTSPEFGRGDLLQEEFENSLFGEATFADLARRRGPFAVISATDMTQGIQIDFTQEFFDWLCVDLSALPIARAVAASSAVPLVFSPITLNNHGGQCGNPQQYSELLAKNTEEHSEQAKIRDDMLTQFQSYQDSQKRPYLHLLDGGLTGNLGLRSMQTIVNLSGGNEKNLYMQLTKGRTNRIVLINVNAQNQIDSDIDQSPAVPGFQDSLNAIINIPIDQSSADAIRQMRLMVDEWNQAEHRDQQGRKISLHFIELSLKDLADETLRHQVLNIPTSFALPGKDVNALRQAATELLKQSSDYQSLIEQLR